MKKFFVVSISILLLLFLPLTVLADSISYPLKRLYPNGIAGASSSLFLNSKIKKPIETGFEERSEIELLTTDNQSGQLAIHEDAYNGKFSLKIQKSQDSIIPISETEYFQTGQNVPVQTVAAESTVETTVSDIKLKIKQKTVTVYGKKAPREMVSLLVEKEGVVAYIDQTTADASGFYTFTFSLKEYDTYQMSVGGSASETIHTSFKLSAEGTSTSIPDPTVGVDVRCNFYTIMLKPMYQSSTISFYVKVKTQDEIGNITEQYALIQSDKDGDGIYKVGEDLSRGKWQEVQLSLEDIDASLRNGTAAGLYMNANQGSEWLLDDITSGYRKISETEFDLANFASGNVVHTGEGLRFANHTQSNSYNTGSRVVSGGMNVLEQLSEIQIDSKLEFSSSNIARHEVPRQILHSVPLESEEWMVHDTDYDTGITGVSKKVQKIHCREVLPKVPASKSMKVSIRPKIEKRFRLILQKKDTSKTVSVSNQSGTVKQYTSSKEFQYTDWYTTNITLQSSVSLSNFLNIYAVEYEVLEDTAQDILMRSQGSATIDLKDLTTDDRTTVSYELIYEKASNLSAGPRLEFFEGDSQTPYYVTRANVEGGSVRQTVSHVVPKIKANTTMKITNLMSGTITDEIRLADIKISKLQERDWNKNIDYSNYSLVHNMYSLGSQKLSFKDEEYAVVYPNASGIVNTGTSSISWDDKTSDIEYDFAIYRFLNLNTEPVSVSAAGKKIWLHYGLADYVAPAGYSLSIPANNKIMFVGKRFYSNSEANPNQLHYTNADGLLDGTVIEQENAIIYPNIYDGNRAYIYNIETESRQKLSEDKLICASPDGTHLLLEDKLGQYSILSRRTMEKTMIALDGYYEEYVFNSNNELFCCYKSLVHYTANGLQTIESGTVSAEYDSLSFDISGEHLLWSRNSIARLYKNTNGIWNLTTQFYMDDDIIKSVLSNDISMAYVQTTKNDIYSVDLNTKTTTYLFDGSILQLTKDNMLLINEDNYYYLYNPVTGEKYKIFNSKFECISMNYNPETNLVIGILANGSVFRHHFTAEEPEAKYALSFDGQDNWYAYSGGRWMVVSKENTPNEEEMKLSGMTAEAVNSIPAAAYEKLYRDGGDILTVDVAIYMSSNSNNQTPVIENIMVKTIEKDDLAGLYGIHMEKYEKDEYRSINSLFPIENFGSNAECYYLLYIGNNWLYTYKNNELIKVEESAEELLTDMSESWITFKQYGMNAQELRRVPGEVLSELFVNEEYANTEFGVIYVVKAKDDNTTGYTVTFRLSSSANFIAEDDIVVEIMMNGGDVKVIDSADFCTTDIKNLLSWIEARQNGNGEIFYQLKNEKTQHFINYYMINSVSVYSGEEYRSKLGE